MCVYVHPHVFKGQPPCLLVTTTPRSFTPQTFILELQPRTS